MSTHEAATRLFDALLDYGIEGYDFNECFELIEEAEVQDQRHEGCLPWNVAYDGKMGGAKRNLDSPKSWRPGCIAFKKDASQIAVLIGGNSYNGGEEWNLFFNAEEEEASK